jgi:transmembrane sensor
MSDERPSLEVMPGHEPAAGAAFWAERMQSDDHVENSPGFQQWLTASEDNHDAWKRVCAAWIAFEEIQDDETVQGLRAEALAFRPRRAMRSWIPFAAAASMALVVGGTFFVRHGLPVDTDGGLPAPVEMAAYTTRIGETSQITLQDGTKLTLDTGTEIEVGFTETARLARLVKGQAFFEVTHDKTHPFRVAMADRVITVLGTKFNMRVVDGSAEVMLVQGSIGVRRGSDPAAPQGTELERLTPGQLMVAGGKGPDRVTHGDEAKELSWRQGLLRFDSTTIGEAAKAFNRYSSRRLVIDDPQIAALRIGGTFRSDDSAGFAKITGQLYGLKVKPLAGHDITLTR